MTPFLHRAITNDTLRASKGRYEGTIKSVEADIVTNPWRFTTTSEGKVVPKKEMVPRILFSDGWEWIPNNRARRALTEVWGADTDRWLGRRMEIYLVIKECVAKNTGELKEIQEKRVKPLDEMPASASDATDRWDVQTSGRIE